MSSRGKPWVPGDSPVEEEETPTSQGRGRPKLPPDKQRKNVVTLTFTDEEYSKLSTAGDRKQLIAWARSILLDAVK
jgi:hypothetical protein